MTTTPHTPGPWTADLTLRKNVYRRVHGEGIAVADICDAGEYDESMSNARLIAAGPELLSALQAIIDRGTTKLPSNLWRQIHHAVDKATGGAE